MVWALPGEILETYRSQPGKKCKHNTPVQLLNLNFGIELINQIIEW